MILTIVVLESVVPSKLNFDVDMTLALSFYPGALIWNQSYVFFTQNYACTFFKYKIYKNGCIVSFSLFKIELKTIF